MAFYYRVRDCVELREVGAAGHGIVCTAPFPAYPGVECPDDFWMQHPSVRDILLESRCVPYGSNRLAAYGSQQHKFWEEEDRNHFYLMADEDDTKVADLSSAGREAIVASLTPASCMLNGCSKRDSDGFFFWVGHSIWWFAVSAGEVGRELLTWYGRGCKYHYVDGKAPPSRNPRPPSVREITDAERAVDEAERKEALAAQGRSRAARARKRGLQEGAALAVEAHADVRKRRCLWLVTHL